MNEYFGNCPKCNHHTIFVSLNTIMPNINQHPQRIAKCNNCHEIVWVTLIGIVLKPLHKRNALRIHLWKLGMKKISEGLLGTEA